MSKYVDFQIEYQRIWNKKVEVIPVIIGATGIVTRTLRSMLEEYQASITSIACRDQQF